MVAAGSSPPPPPVCEVAVAAEPEKFAESAAFELTSRTDVALMVHPSHNIIYIGMTHGVAVHKCITAVTFLANSIVSDSRSRQLFRFFTARSPVRKRVLKVQSWYGKVVSRYSIPKKSLIPR